RVHLHLLSCPTRRSSDLRRGHPPLAGLRPTAPARGGDLVTAAEIVRFALRGLTANKLRSALTTLGILIGVAAVILLVAVGRGRRDRKSTRLNSSHVKISY